MFGKRPESYVWRDVTAYRPGEAKKRADAFSFRMPAMIVILVCDHSKFPGVWAVSCAGVGMPAQALDLQKDVPAETAQRAALKAVARWLAERLSEIMDVAKDDV